MTTNYLREKKLLTNKDGQSLLLLLEQHLYTPKELVPIRIDKDNWKNQQKQQGKKRRGTYEN